MISTLCKTNAQAPTAFAFTYHKIENKYSTKNTQTYLINYLVNGEGHKIELHCIDVNLAKQIKLRGGNVVGNIISTGIICQKFTVVVLGSLFTNTINSAANAPLENYLTTVVFKELKIKPNLLLLRDYSPTTVFETNNNYKFIPNDVVMNFTVDAAWNTIQDYCVALSKKYKTRALKTLEAITELECIELTLDEIKKYQTEINSLFNQVVNKQELSIIEHNDNYFYTLKQNLGTNFKFFGWKNTNNELLAFMPIILHSTINCEVHYIGYNSKHNNTYRLYQNILMRAVQFGIEHKISTINLGHTSLEAKAILGAKPIVVSHAYATKGIIAKYMINHIVSHIDEVYNADWKDRNPFK